MGTIYLVRHGQASFGADDYDQLSPLGTEQSRMLGDWIRHCKLSVDRVLMGGNRRHRQTALACLSAVPQCPPESQWRVVAGFSEFDHGEVMRRFRPDLSDDTAVNAWLAGKTNARREFQKVFGPAFQRWVMGEQDGYVESYAAFRKRCWSALTGVLQDEAGGTWIFTSGGPITAIVQQLLGIDKERIAELTWSLVNTGVTRL